MTKIAVAATSLNVILVGHSILDGFPAGVAVGAFPTWVGFFELSNLEDFLAFSGKLPSTSLFLAFSFGFGFLLSLGSLLGNAGLGGTFEKLIAGLYEFSHTRLGSGTVFEFLDRIGTAGIVVVEFDQLSRGGVLDVNVDFGGRSDVFSFHDFFLLVFDVFVLEAFLSTVALSPELPFASITFFNFFSGLEKVTSPVSFFQRLM